MYHLNVPGYSSRVLLQQHILLVYTISRSYVTIVITKQFTYVNMNRDEMFYAIFSLGLFFIHISVGVNGLTSCKGRIEANGSSKICWSLKAQIYIWSNMGFLYTTDKLVLASGGVLSAGCKRSPVKACNRCTVYSTRAKINTHGFLVYKA